MKVLLILLSMISFSSFAQEELAIMSCDCSDVVSERISRDSFGIEETYLSSKRVCSLKEGGSIIKKINAGFISSADTICRNAAYKCVKYKTGVELIQVHRTLTSIRDIYEYKTVTGSGRVLRTGLTKSVCNEVVAELRERL